MTRLLTSIAAPTVGSAAETDRDPARMLHDHASRWVDDNPPAHPRGRMIAGLIPATKNSDDPEVRHAVADIEHLMNNRIRALTENLLRHPPPSARPLGPPPREITARRDWLHAIGVIAAYRDLHQVGGDSLLGPGAQPDDPTGMRRIATTAAAVASRLARERRRTSGAATKTTTAERSLQR